MNNNLEEVIMWKATLNDDMLLTSSILIADPLIQIGRDPMEFGGSGYNDGGLNEPAWTQMWVKIYSSL